MKDSERLFQALLRLYSGEERKTAVLILSDALDEEGNLDLANAYRWAAYNDKWPFQRASRPNRFHPKHDPRFSIGEQKVWDWQPDNSVEGLLQLVPKEAIIPGVWGDFMFLMKDRAYDGVWEAFVILARAMSEYDKSITPPSPPTS